MGLHWVRLDSNIASHDKILRLLEMKDGTKAAWAYVCGLGHCGGHGSDGLITFQSLPFIHCTKRHAEMLVEVGLWQPVPLGWQVPNWATRQESSGITDAKRIAQSVGAHKANCQRWHGMDCGCWKEHVA
jgi:hypothetical protein